MSDVLLEDNAPAAGGKKNKKKRGKVATNPQELQDKGPEDYDKMAERFSTDVQKEIDEMKAEWAGVKDELVAQKIQIEKKCKET